MTRAVTLCLLLLFCGASTAAAPARHSVCVYYDGEENATGFTGGERSALMVRNLLGHFKEVETFTAPLARYSASALSACDRAIYLGTYFDAKVPDAFLADVSGYRRPFLWMNYNIWKLQQRLGIERFSAAWGFAYQSVAAAVPRGSSEIPHFHRSFTYKGATFRKAAYLTPRGFIGHAEIIVVRNRSAQVLSEGIHSGTGQRTPYVLRKGDLFYVADNPVSVIDERDRYLILADLLFDFLKLQPRSEKRYAAVRIEDVHPGYDLRLLYQTINVFRSRKVPFAISLIPRYVGPRTRGLDATDDARFMRMIRYAIDNGASILVHGYEHHLTTDLGCGVTYTGEGYEFWDACNDRPIPFESVEYVQQRVDKAKKILENGNIAFAGWVTPHYMASPLALRVIHENFGRLMQHMTYFLEGRPATAANAVDQFFPYTIYNDYYGFHVWPENLGYVPLPLHGGKAQNVDEMLETAHLYKVVRDAWASFFWHPPLIKTELGIRSLEKLVDGLIALGYEFASLEELRKRGE